MYYSCNNCISKSNIFLHDCFESHNLIIKFWYFSLDFTEKVTLFVQAVILSTDTYDTYIWKLYIIIFSRSLYTKAHFPLSTSMCALTRMYAMKLSDCQIALQEWTPISPIQWLSAVIAASALWTHPTAQSRAYSLIFACLRENFFLHTNHRSKLTTGVYLVFITWYKRTRYTFLKI